jgi:hypothetical protein
VIFIAETVTPPIDLFNRVNNLVLKVWNFNVLEYLLGSWFGVYYDVAPGAPAFSLDTPGEFPY